MKLEKITKVDLVEQLKSNSTLLKEEKLLKEKLANMKVDYDNALKKLSDTGLLEQEAYLSDIGFEIKKDEYRVTINEYDKIQKQYDDVKAKIISKKEIEGDEFFKIDYNLILELGVKYDLKLLPVNLYRGDIDNKLTDKIKAFKETETYKNYGENKITFLVLAPSELFSSLNVTIVKDVVDLDPVLVALCNDDKQAINDINRLIKEINDVVKKITKYDSDRLDNMLVRYQNIISDSKLFFVHKWGNDFTFLRRIKSTIKNYIRTEYVFNIANCIIGSMLGLPVILTYLLKLSTNVKLTDISLYNSNWLFNAFILYLAVYLIYTLFDYIIKKDKYRKINRRNIFTPEINITTIFR